MNNENSFGPTEKSKADIKRNKARIRNKRWRHDNPDKNFEAEERARIRRKNPEVKARMAATNKAWREKTRPKRIIIEELP